MKMTTTSNVRPYSWKYPRWLKCWKNHSLIQRLFRSVCRIWIQYDCSSCRSGTISGNNNNSNNNNINHCTIQSTWKWFWPQQWISFRITKHQILCAQLIIWTLNILYAYKRNEHAFVGWFIDAMQLRIVTIIFIFDVDSFEIHVLLCVISC